MSGPGSRGVHRPSVHNSINTAAASTAVGQCTSRRWASNDLTNSMNSSPDTFVPVIFPIWLAIITIAMPVMYPTSTGRDKRSARKPKRAMPPARQIPPTMSARTAASKA